MVLVAVVIVYNTVIGIDISLPLVFLLGYLTCQAWGSMWRVVKRLFW
ncbi:hypothetical protein [Bifidobacterium sp. UBA4282]|nr:hypothetical protein [Bifidobacterium sp. UBA4282]